jgi:hypothetical protein
MPHTEFLVDDGEYRVEGIAKYHVTEGCPGDMITPPEPRGVESFKVVGVSQVCVKMDVLWVDITHQVFEPDWRRWVENNRALMGEIQSACDQAEGVVL